MEIYYTFSNTHTVILAERVLLSAGFSVKVRPVPTAIKADCGLCLCIDESFSKAAEKEMQKNSVSISASYILKDGKFILK